MGHELLVADLRLRVTIHLRLSMIQQCIQINTLNIPRGFPQMGGHTGTFGRRKLQGKVHDGFIGRGHV